MERRTFLKLAALVPGLALAGCGGSKTLLSPKDPTMLSIWHVYGEQADSPMNRLLTEFNDTVGREKGILLNVTNMTNSAAIGGQLQDAKAGKPGALDLPDLFSAHPADASALGIENLVDWNDWFTAEDMAAYVPGFVQDGIIDGKQVVFPVSKSTQLIFLNGSQYARFAADTGAQLSTLATWDGFFEMAGAYRQWSQGKPFCALDYPLRLVELNALEQGSGKLYKGSWYDLTNETFRASWMEFARALVQGDILISDLYSNTQVMTGETLAGLGSSAAILYYNDFVTYPDNTTEPTDLLLAPLPHAAGTATPLMPQAGVGLCAFKTTDQKAEAAAVFLRWLTEQQRNLEFAADTGYMPVFQNDMERYFDQLAVMGVNLSEDMGALVDRQLASREMTFDQLNDSPEVLNALEEEMIEPLCRSLRRTSCSGAFVLLDATVNTRMEGAGYSRAGLYVQKGGADTPTVPLLLYRGSADVGKTHSVMPHRKWRMEFQTDQFPDYDRWMTPSSTPLYQAYTLTERFSLPGTSEEVQLFLLPLRGRDGTMYGLCGFEISQSFFKQNFAQPTGFDHLICLLAPADSGLNASAALSSGTTGGYFHAPRDMLVLRSMGGSLTQLIGSDSAYAGISELCRLSENQSYRLAVCIPMTDYRRLIFSGNLQMLLIGLFILFFVVFCCMYFHQHILSPAFRQFEEDRRESRRRMDELQMERQQMQTELSRLADVCRNESVPDAFQTFLEGIPNLTKTERRIFDGYVAGLRSREIVEQLDIKDSTLRFHNKNIYEKLGVSSLKQLQQFAAILNSGGNSAPDSAPDESGPKKARLNRAPAPQLSLKRCKKSRRTSHRCSGSFILILGSGRSGDASGSLVQLCAGGAPAAFFYCSIGFIVGTGQGRLTNGFIFLYKPIHAASFFLLPYVTLRNSPQLTGNLV